MPDTIPESLHWRSVCDELFESTLLGQSGRDVVSIGIITTILHCNIVILVLLYAMCFPL